MRKILIAMLILLWASAPALAGTIDMEVFVIDPCGGCAGSAGVGCKNCSIIDELTVRYRNLLPEDELKLTVHNLRMDNSYHEVFRTRIAAFGVDPDDVPLPVVFISGEPFLADGSMDDAILRFIDSGETPGIESLLREKAEYEASKEPGRIVYLYSPYCEDCHAISKWLTYSVPYGYELVKYDIYTDAGRAMEEYYLEELGIPAEEYRLPMIVYGDDWFAGKKSIYLSLKSRIQEHPDLKTTILEEIA